jgi:hypothetical protein
MAGRLHLRRPRRQPESGCNRYLACEKAGIEPTFKDYEGDDAGAPALVISLNVQRHDLTAAQRAIGEARAREQFPERRGGNRRSADQKASMIPNC